MEVKTSALSDKEFIESFYKINKDCTNWVPPLFKTLNETLDVNKHPYWIGKTVLFVKVIAGKQVTAISVFFCTKGERQGFFGFFNSVNKPRCVSALFQKGFEFLKQNNCDHVEGPYCPSINYELGVLVDGFDTPPYFMLAHNHQYYDELIKSTGLVKASDFYSYHIQISMFSKHPKLIRSVLNLKSGGELRIRSMNIKKLNDEMKILHALYNDAFEGHYGFVPMSLEEFIFMGKDLKAVLDPDLTLIAELNGKPIAFLLAFPDLNQVFIKLKNGRLWPWGWLKFLYYRRKINRVRVVTMGVLHKYRHLGIGALLYDEIANRIIRKGYVNAEYSWVEENNLQMNKSAKWLGGMLYKTYRIYRRSLDDII